MKIVEIENNSEEQIIANKIKTECGPWLSESQNGRLIFYRGTKTIKQFSKHAFTTDVVQNREPRDSSPSATEAFNDAISLAGGVANRVNSVFMSSDYSTAMSYVNNSSYVFVAIPIGEFHYTWSHEFLDWFTDAIQQGKILNYVDRKLAVESLKSKNPSINTINDYSFLDPNKVRYSVRRPVATYFVPVDFIDTDGVNQKKEFKLEITYNMIVTSALAKDITCDTDLKGAEDIYAEVMLHPLSQKVLLINPYFYSTKVLNLLL